MTSEQGRKKMPRSQYGKYDEDYDEEPIDDDTETRSRRTRKTRNVQESDDEKEDVRRVGNRRRGRRTRQDDEDDEDDEDEEKQEYSSRKKKENNSSEARGHSYEDNVSDDEPGRRSRKNDGSNRQIYDEEAEVSRQSTRKSRSTRNDEEVEVSRQSTRKSRSTRNDEEAEVSRQSTRKSRSTRNDEEYDDDRESRRTRNDDSDNRRRRTRNDSDEDGEIKTITTNGSIKDSEEEVHEERRNRRSTRRDEEDDVETEPPRRQKNRQHENDEQEEDVQPRSRQRRRADDEQKDEEEIETVEMEDEINEHRSKRRERQRSPEEKETRRRPRRVQHESDEEEEEVENRRTGEPRDLEEDEEETRPSRSRRSNTETRQSKEDNKDDHKNEQNPFQKYEGDKTSPQTSEQSLEERAPSPDQNGKNPYQKYKDGDGTTQKISKQLSEERAPSPDQVDKNPYQKYKSDETTLENPDQNSKNPFGKYEEKIEEVVKTKPSVAVKKKNPFNKYGGSRENSIEETKEKKKQASFSKGNLKGVGKLNSKPRSSFEKPKVQQTSIEQIEDSSEKKKRRRDKDASSAILDVINWDRGADESYEGSSLSPDVKEGEYKPTLDGARENTFNGADRAEEKGEEEQKKNKEEEEREKEKFNQNDKSERENGEKGINEDDRVSEASSAITSTIQVKQRPQESETVCKNKDDDKVTDDELKESLNYLNRLPDLNKLTPSNVLESLMDTYLNQDYLIGHSKPATLQTPKIRKLSDEVEKMDELEKNLKNIRKQNRKQPPPPVRNKPSVNSRAWEDPREHQRVKNKEKAWPPKEPPTDAGNYVVESYGQTDPYSKRLIKDIQRSKRQEEEKREAEKRAEIIAENIKPVSHLRSTFSHKPTKSNPGALRPEIHIAEERSWIKHEKKPVVFDAPPDEPDWMRLIRNRRWNSTVKARFPCKSTDKTDFERRSTTPKNWKRLAKDKNALRMLSEIVGIGAEGEELFMRLANQRQKIEDDEGVVDKLTEEELMAYEVARETLGEDTAYSLQMDNPLPAARMRPLNSTSTLKGGSFSGSTETLDTLNTTNYPFTTSQLEAAYLTNQLLRLHPEEFRKLMSLERSRQATLRWQFSADPFDSVHDHQSLPFEIALFASEEPRVQQAMKRILATSQDNYGSVFTGSRSITPLSKIHRTRSDAGYRHTPTYSCESDYDGYESSHSISSNSSVGSNVVRGRPRKKKPPVPVPRRVRGRSVSPSMLRKNSADNLASGPTLTVPRLNSAAARKQLTDDREVHAHGLLTDQELALSEEIAKLQELTSNIGRDIDEELKGIESSLEDRKKGFFEEAIRNESFDKGADPGESIDVQEIASRRKKFLEKDLLSSVVSDVRAEIPKTRHKVRRINSNAQLDAVFRRRRLMSETNKEEDEVEIKTETPPDTKNEISNLMDNINNTFGVSQ